MSYSTLQFCSVQPHIYLDWWHSQIPFFIWQPQLSCNILLLLLWIFNAKSGVLLRRDLHMRELIVLYEHCTSEQLSRTFGGSIVPRVPSLFIHTLQIKHDSDWPTHARARVSNFVWWRWKVTTANFMIPWLILPSKSIRVTDSYSYIGDISVKKVSRNMTRSRVFHHIRWIWFIVHFGASFWTTKLIWLSKRERRLLLLL